MIFAFILLAIILIFVLILFTNVKIRIKYHETLKLTFYFGWFKIPEGLFEKKKKEEKQTENETKTVDKTKNKNTLFDKIKEKGVYQSFLEVIEFFSPVLNEVGAFLKKVKVDPLKIDIKMVGDDAAKLAIDYGKFCAVYYPVIELIDSKTKCKNINSNVYVDYTSKLPSVFIKTELKFRLVSGIISGLKIVNLFMQFKEKFK